MQLVDCGILWFGRLVYDSSRFVDSNKSISRPKLESLPVLRRQIATASKRSIALLLFVLYYFTGLLPASLNIDWAYAFHGRWGGGGGGGGLLVVLYRVRGPIPLGEIDN